VAQQATSDPNAVVQPDRGLFDQTKPDDATHVPLTCHLQNPPDISEVSRKFQETSVSMPYLPLISREEGGSESNTAGTQQPEVEEVFENPETSPSGKTQDSSVADDIELWSIEDSQS
jgi:hypothetical protein